MSLENLDVNHVTEVPITGIAIELESDATLGYASIQNSVPVIRSLRLTNHGEDALEGLEVLIACNPGFAQGTKLRFDRLAAGETRRISPIELQPDHSYLADLVESVNASVTVSVLAGSNEIATKSQSIQILAYDQWAGTRALPELLAAFCMPNNPAIDVLIGKASKLLRSQYNELSMNGYQSKSRDVVWKQVSAIYSTISAENLQYAEPPASFGRDGQKIRTADRILEGRIATCLDLTMLFCSCIEQAGLRPVVLFKEGHAWVGVWLHSACFPDPLLDDVQAVRKRVDSGEFLAFETTGIAEHHTRRFSLRIALERGQEHLQEKDSFRYAIDIHRAREVQIKPLPSRSILVKLFPAEATEDPSGIEPTPLMPTLDPEFLTPIELGTQDTPEGRLSNWKSKLLDLTLRNRLLNFKPTKSTLQFIAPDLPRLEDVLADGTEFRIRPLPAIMEGNDPRSGQVHASKTGRAALDDMALAALENKEFLANVSQDALDGNLLSIFSAARTGLEEGGANTLFLAVGLLEWTEVEKAEAKHLAPILLIPVTLERQSVRSGFRLRRHDDEAIINPTLLQLLKNSFELRVAGLDVIPTEDKGIDVAKVLQSFRLAVREIAKWEVLEQAHLGIFSFKKYLMWKDLQDRTEQLKGNRVVKHLIENPGEAFAREGNRGEFDRLDETHQPQDILAPLLADSSQLKAICAIDAGRDLVLEGPPGTGKSQTITNLIAHNLAKGKTVLFVSEKMAALEVVHRRLNDIGLGPFCLELHSSKARKIEVLQQLGKALDITGERTASDWAREAEQLGLLRQELNGLVDALHRFYPNGLTAFSAIGTCIQSCGNEPSTMPWTDALTHSREQLDGLRETCRRISAMAQDLGPLSGHPLAAIGKSEWSPSWGDELSAASTLLATALGSLTEKSQTVGDFLRHSTQGLSLEGYAALDQLADVLLAAPKVPEGLARQAHDVRVRAMVQSLAKHGAARSAHWVKAGVGWTPQLAKLNATDLKSQWSQATLAWWPKTWFAKRAFAGRLVAFRTDSNRPTPLQIEPMIDALADINDEDQILLTMHAEAELVLQGAYNGIQTDWASLTAHEQWALKFTDAVTQVAGADPQEISSLRLSLQALVSENRAHLAPTGHVGRALLAYRDAWRDVRQKKDILDTLAHPVEPLSGPLGADGALARIQGVLTGWNLAKQKLRPWCLWRSVRDKAISQGLQGLVTSLEAGSVALPEAEPHFDFSYCDWWLKKIMDIDPVLRNFSSADHERKIREFRLADTKFQKLTEKYIAATLSGRIPTTTGAMVGADSELGRLRRELQKQRRHMPVRQLVQGLPTLLPKLKPCLLMSPLSVAQYLDAGYAPFDLVVFDEASQIPVWDAVGAIARGKQLAVVGDPKQLPPTNFFSKSTDSEGGSEEQVEDLESILDECLGAGMNRLSLQWHYRSRHESLITFSNVHYYDSNLVTFPSPVTDDVAVKFERVNGIYDRGATRTNRIEAEAIVKGIEKHYLTASKSHLTIGVVTFNQPQQALIETLLDARRRSNQELDRAIAERSHEPLFIKNLENVQGDERDVIFFSITFGPDAAGKTTMNFGPLNGEGGHRRLNVAISRAREAVVIYSTLLPEQIELSKVRAAGVRDLKHYLEFAIKGPRALVQQSVPTGLEPDSPFETAVIRILRNHNWVVHPQVGCSGYRIDIGVVDPRAPGRYLVGIECDGRSYHSGASARDRDRLRQHVLEGLGWRIHRIWSTDWWLNQEDEVKKITEKLHALMEEESHSAEEVLVDDILVDAVAETAQAPAPKEVARTEPVGTALPIYTPATLSARSPDAFYEYRTASLLTEQMSEVIEGEGPVSEAVLFRKVARAWGLERTGSRIVERLKALAPSSASKTIEDSNTFYWPKSVQHDSLRHFRVADDTATSKRHIDEVCIEEISALVLQVLHQAGSAPRPDVARSVCRLVGMAAVNTTAVARAVLAIDRLKSASILLEVGDTISLNLRKFNTSVNDHNQSR
jgi:very-short-patch-repair endonuclease